jgi:hypothetical protein
VTKTRFFRRARDEHAEFFSAQFHGRTVSGRGAECQRGASLEAGDEDEPAYAAFSSERTLLASSASL